MTRLTIFNRMVSERAPSTITLSSDAAEEQYNRIKNLTHVSSSDGSVTFSTINSGSVTLSTINSGMKQYPMTITMENNRDIKIIGGQQTIYNIYNFSKIMFFLRAFLSKHFH